MKNNVEKKKKKRAYDTRKIFCSSEGAHTLQPTEKESDPMVASVLYVQPVLRLRFVWHKLVGLGTGERQLFSVLMVITDRLWSCQHTGVQYSTVKVQSDQFGAHCRSSKAQKQYHQKR